MTAVIASRTGGTDKPSHYGWRVFGLGVAAMGAVNLVLGNFDPGQPVPKTFPDRMILAYGVSTFMLAAGAAIAWRRTTAWAAAALTAYYALFVILLMNGRVILTHYAEYGVYSGAAEDVAIAAAGLILCAANADISEVLAARLTRGAQMAFGVCAVLFGVAHFVYPNFTIPLTPKWLPPSQAFWTYATGVFHIAGGVAIITGVRARLAAILLTVMYASFTPLVHLPTLFIDPHKPFFWTENALNITLAGAAWVMADSLAPLKRALSGS